MKSKTFTAGRFFLALGAMLIGFVLVSWDHKQSPGIPGQTFNDTVPKTKGIERDKKVRDLDDVLRELDNVDLKMNLENAQKQIDEAMKSLDGEKIRAQVEKAMKDVDMEKIQQQYKDEIGRAHV